jgi:hypothetical protein
MFRAELHGKLPRPARESEDVLTSAVFGYLEVAPREVLSLYLRRVLDLPVSESDAEDALFQFWPTYPDGTEPDLVVEVGDYYLLVEAKLGSGFGVSSTDAEQNQLRREIRQGLSAAGVAGRTFRLVTITLEPFIDPRRYPDIHASDRSFWRPTNWQRFTEFLDGLDSQVIGLLGVQLRDLLHARGYRGFRGYLGVSSEKVPALSNERIFFAVGAARHAGGFRGFQASLARVSAPMSTSRVFWSSGRRFKMNGLERIRCTKTVFWEQRGRT